MHETHKTLSLARVREILAIAAQSRVLVIGDVMLDHFIWGSVGRISPEAPVVVVDMASESFIPGGAANVARNLTALEAPTELFGVVGRDHSATQLKQLLNEHQIGCAGLLASRGRLTSMKTRIVAHQQQVVRLDRETRGSVDARTSTQLLAALESQIINCAAVIVGDYGKGVITRPLLEELKKLCRQHGVWLSLDPKPVHQLDLSGLSLITPQPQGSALNSRWRAGRNPRRQPPHRPQPPAGGRAPAQRTSARAAAHHPRRTRHAPLPHRAKSPFTFPRRRRPSSMFPARATR